MSAGSSETTPTKRILLVRTDRLGDVILTLPMLAALRSCFPDAYIAMLLRRYTGEIVVGNPHVNELIWYDDGADYLPLRTMRRILRVERFDIVIVGYPTLRLAWLMFTSGIPIRVATGYRYYSFLFNRRVFEHRKDAKRHEVEYNLNLLKQVGCEAVDRPAFFLHIPEDVERNVEELLAALGVERGMERLIVHPGSGGSAREWPARSFGEVAARISKGRNMQVIVTGAAGEEAKVDEVLKENSPRAVSVAGKLGVKELAALLRSASLFLGNSTGPIHIAAAVGTPVVGLYPQIVPMSPRRWGPYTTRKRVLVPAKPIDCKDCLRRSGEPCLCMASIPVEDVYAAACSLLDESKNKREAPVAHA